MTVKKIALWLIAALLIGGGLAMYALREIGPKWIERLQGDSFTPLAGSQRYELDETRSLRPATLEGKGLTVETVFESIEVTREAREDIEIRLLGHYTAPLEAEQPKISVRETADGRVEIEIDRGLNFSPVISASNVRLQIKIPQDLAGDLTLQSISGAVKLRTPSAKPLEGALEAGSVSGRVYVEDLHAREVRLYSTSGAIELSGSAGALDAKTVSGEILLKLTELAGDGNIRSTSGSLDLEVREPLDHEILLTTTSGQLSLEREGFRLIRSEDRRIEAVEGTGEYTLEMSTVSGGVTVR